MSRQEWRNASGDAAIQDFAPFRKPRSSLRPLSVFGKDDRDGQIHVDGFVVSRQGQVEPLDFTVFVFELDEGFPAALAWPQGFHDLCQMPVYG